MNILPLIPIRVITYILGPLADLLTNDSRAEVENFFASIDAILLEIRPGERWAIFGRPTLETHVREPRN